MKKSVFKFNILVIVICLTALILSSFSGCALLPKYSDPKSVTIDGEKYVGNFYGDMYADLEYKEDETCLFETKYHYWWRLEDSTFDLYYCRNKESMLWFPALYCKKSQFNEIKSYYANPENYEYYIGLKDKGGQNHTQKLTGDLNGQILERAITFKNNATSSIFSKDKYQTATLYLDNVDYARPLLYRVSKDGIFTTLKSPWICYREKIYLLDYNDGRTDEYKVFVPDDEISDYMIKLLKDNGFELN